MNSQKISGIYKIISPTGRIYIGKSNNIKKRWGQYKNLKNSQQPIISASINKYGYDKHLFEVIEECKTEDLTERELYWYNHYCKNYSMLNAVIPNTLEATNISQLDIQLEHLSIEDRLKYLYYLKVKEKVNTVLDDIFNSDSKSYIELAKYIINNGK